MKRKKYKLSGSVVPSAKNRFDRYGYELVSGVDSLTGKKLTAEEMSYRKGFWDGFFDGKYQKYEKMNTYYKKYR